MFSLWIRYQNVRFIQKEELLDADLPLQPMEFEELVKDQCMSAHLTLKNKLEKYLIYTRILSVVLVVNNIISNYQLLIISFRANTAYIELLFTMSIYITV